MLIGGHGSGVIWMFLHGRQAGWIGGHDFFHVAVKASVPVKSRIRRLPINLAQIMHYVAAADNQNALLSQRRQLRADRKSTRLNSSHVAISYAVFCLKKKNTRWSPVTDLSRSLIS